MQIFLIPHSNPGVRGRALECEPSMRHLILIHPMEGQQKRCGRAPAGKEDAEEGNCGGESSLEKIFKE